jgi:hypothetical protein
MTMLWTTDAPNHPFDAPMPAPSSSAVALNSAAPRSKSVATDELPPNASPAPMPAPLLSASPRPPGMVSADELPSRAPRADAHDLEQFPPFFLLVVVARFH